MNKIGIAFLGNKTSFGVDKIKYFLGDNYIDKYEIFKTIKKHFYKVENSEYLFEKKLESSFRINDQEVDYKKWKLLEINEQFDFLNDIKLGTKSLTQKYVESRLMQIEYEDTLNTINILIKDFEKILIEKIDFNDSENKLDITFDEFNLKNIIKSIAVNIRKEDYSQSPLDLTYEELICLQIMMVEGICSENKLNEYLVLMSLPILTKKICKTLEEIGRNNVSFLVVTSEKSITTDYMNVLNVSKQIIDFSNEVDVYNNLVMNHKSVVNTDEIIDIINEYISGNINERTKELIENL